MSVTEKTRRELLSRPGQVIVVTDRKQCSEPFENRIDGICRGQPDMLLLREKDLTDTAYAELFQSMGRLTAPYHTPLTGHSHPELDRCDMHLTMPQLRVLGTEGKQTLRLIGASVHSPEEAREAEKLGADYLIAGHIFNTPCKQGTPGRGLDYLRRVCESVSIPVFGIGGITPKNARDVIAAGAKGVCVMGTAMTAPDPADYIRRLRRAVRRPIAPSQLMLYAVTDPVCLKDRDLCQSVESAIRGGATFIQLRDKTASHGELVKQARALKAVCAGYGVPLIVNDDWKAALEAGADGCHVGIEDAPVEEIRAQAGEGFIIGATAKTVEQAKAAEAAGADYLGVGAVFPSPTKPGAIRITGEQFRGINASVDIPCAAIGGISLDNIRELKDMGAAGYAVVSAVFGQENIEEAARQLIQAISDM